MSTVLAQVRYLNEEWKDRDEVPQIGSRESRRANTSKREVVIHDARSSGFEPDVDANGFQLVDHEPGVIDFRDPKEVEARYYPEIEALVTTVVEQAGATVEAVLFTGNVVRTEDTSDFNKAYARFVHCDYSQNGMREAAAKLLRDRGYDPDDYADAEFVWFNSWQPIERPAIKNPLSLVDCSSLAPGDVVDYYYTGYGKKDSLTAMPVFNPDHEFYYFPNMQTNELLLIKQLDTRDGVASLCPHTSFDNEAAPADALPRRSIEVRMMCVLR